MTHIHVIGSPESAFFVNAFILESAKNIVLVDTHFLYSSIDVMCNFAASFGKCLQGIFLTHPHPDHFNGVDRVCERFGSVPVFSSRETAEAMQAMATAKVATWAPKYGDDYPTKFRYPNEIIASGSTLRLGDIEILPLNIGAGESCDLTVLGLSDDRLIASDLVYNRCHPWLAEGRSGEWLRQIDLVQNEFPGIRQVFAGHGPAGGREALSAQRDYLLRFRELVGTNTDDHALVDDLRRKCPGWPLDFLIPMNVDGVRRELIAAKDDIIDSTR